MLAIKIVCGAISISTGIMTLYRWKKDRSNDTVMMLLGVASIILGTWMITTGMLRL